MGLKYKWLMENQKSGKEIGILNLEKELESWAKIVKLKHPKQEKDINHEKPSGVFHFGLVLYWKETWKRGPQSQNTKEKREFQRAFKK